MKSHFQNKISKYCVRTDRPLGINKSAVNFMSSTYLHSTVGQHNTDFKQISKLLEAVQLNKHPTWLKLKYSTSHEGQLNLRQVMLIYLFFYWYPNQLSKVSLCNKATSKQKLGLVHLTVFETESTFLNGKPLPSPRA